MRFIVLVVFGLMAVAPASAQYAALRPAGAVSVLDGCEGMSGYPDCHPDRIYEGRSAAIPVHPGIHRRAHAHPAGTQFYPGR